MELRQFIDHTLLHPTTSPEAIERLCEEAIEHQFYAVCVSSCYAALAVDLLKSEKTKVAATVGFPLGSANIASKMAETKKCLEDGVDEIDMVLNLGFLKAGIVKRVVEEISNLKKILENKILKVIIETCYLTDNQKRLASTLAEEGGADFVKTSTGFGTGGATLHDIKLIKSVVPRMKIKASGGIHTGKDALAFIAAGANRIGTSNGINLIRTQ